MWVYPLAILLVFMVLAALYESLVLPLSITLIVPTGFFSAMAGGGRCTATTTSSRSSASSCS